MQSVDTSLEDIIRLRKQRLGKPIRYSKFKRLKQPNISSLKVTNKLISRNNGNKQALKKANILRDAREKLQSKSDLRVKLEIKNSSPGIRTPQIHNRYHYISQTPIENKKFSIINTNTDPPQTATHSYSHTLDDQLLSNNEFSGLPSYNETKKIQITIKGLNQPKKKDRNSLRSDIETAPIPVRKGYYAKDNYMRNSPPAQYPRRYSYSGATSHGSFLNHNRHTPPLANRHPSHSSLNSTRSLVTGTKLIISNLSATVIRRDIEELCEAIGKVENVTLQDSIAEVTFATKLAATEAFKTYHNRHLDGRAMICRLTSNYAPSNSHATEHSSVQNYYAKRHSDSNPIFTVKI